MSKEQIKIILKKISTLKTKVNKMSKYEETEVFKKNIKSFNIYK